jgi:tRNA threonylcarbamoyladenosine biosynthesis protein TsaE
MDFNRTVVTKSPGETKELGKTLSDTLIIKKEKGELSGPIILCLYGELGSGKTTFIQGMLQGLGIETRILSPTFIIVRRYECQVLDRSISHIDCYRLTKEIEIEGLGFDEDFSNQSGLVLVEWADRVGNSKLPEERMDITFETADGNHRVKVIKDSYGFTHR